MIVRGADSRPESGAAVSEREVKTDGVVQRGQQVATQHQLSPPSPSPAVTSHISPPSWTHSFQAAS